LRGWAPVKNFEEVVDDEELEVVLALDEVVGHSGVELVEEEGETLGV
jgi:hypothetical protein